MVEPQVAVLFSLLEKIRAFLKRLGLKQALLKQVLNSISLKDEIRELNKQLILNYTALLAALNWRSSLALWTALSDHINEEDELDAREDQKDYQLLLGQLMSNEARLLSSLELERLDIPDAIVALKKAEGKLGSDIEQSFVKHAYQTLSKMADGIEIEIQPWSVSLLEVDIGQEIASGGFGRVSHGVWLGHDRVAVKQLLVNCETTRQKKMFLKEVETWYRLRHPHILELYGAAPYARPPLMICPFMPNGTLSSYAEKYPNERLRLLYETGLGLNYLHSASVIHGDLKAINILIDSTGHARVSDFGFSVMRAVVSSKVNSVQSGFGTLRWAAPERLKGSKPDFPWDTYSFGMVCFEVLSEELPFEHVSDNGILMQMVIGGKRPDRPDDVTDTMWDLMERCWRQDPKEWPVFRTIAGTLKTMVPGLESASIANERTSTLQQFSTPSTQRQKSSPTHTEKATHHGISSEIRTPAYNGEAIVNSKTISATVQGPHIPPGHLASTSSVIVVPIRQFALFQFLDQPSFAYLTES
ncbi:Mitogen-activated protein kinase kinase kinase mlk-1 [Rhizophlyctis rosea]|nr:Mitogen-activated protein kinase kinase kinase mlk-1 [Rhizophlyctis rosea]